MGVTIYQALLLEFPYGRAPITERTPPVPIPKKLARSWPANLDLVLQKALQPDRCLRYRSAAELRDDWQRVRTGSLPHKASVNLWRRTSHISGRWGIPLTAVGLAAIVLAMCIPPEKVVRKVLVKTNPPGARVALVPLDPVNGAPRFDAAIQPAGKTPLEVPGVAPGYYLVIVEVANYGFHEVFRRVPKPSAKSQDVIEIAAPPGERNTVSNKGRPEVQADAVLPHLDFSESDGVVELPRITILKSDVTNDMALFRGGEFVMGDEAFAPANAPPHRVRVEAFYLDKTEVTAQRYEEVQEYLPRKMRALKPKPSDAVCFVDFDQATRCAELMGKRLPGEAEYEFAATNGGHNRFPWGDDFSKVKSWRFGSVGIAAYDRALANPSVCGLYSNVAEWTNSWHAPYPGADWPLSVQNEVLGQRIVRGGPECVAYDDADPAGRAPDVRWSARYRYGLSHGSALRGVGFRCARSLKPRFPTVSKE
jgi:formylglycine-generating enzyme required for sulfatase activity